MKKIIDLYVFEMNFNLGTCLHVIFGFLLCLGFQLLNFKDYLHLETESSKPEPDKKFSNKFSQKEPFETSGWCNGDTVETRMCHFKNICYKPSTGKFVILLSENSTFMGFNSSHSR